jgi:hypothetical protein
MIYLKQSCGTVVLNFDELFVAIDETGVLPEEARYITINASVTELKYKKNDALVNFRIGDHEASPKIIGSYK